MPKAEASLPSARERRLSLATPAIESTIASRKFRSFSFCPRTNGSSFRGLWFLFAELAIFGRRPWLAGRERRLTKGHFQPGARRVLPGKNEQKSCSFEAL